MKNAIQLISPPSHRMRWPNLTNAATIEEWRQAKQIEDGTNKDAESDMVNAFGCHGEPIALAIADTINRLAELVPDTKVNEKRRIMLEGFQKVCDEMTDVRSELDTLIDRMANEQKQEGWNEAESSLPCGYDANASDYGVDLNSSLEDAFEAGVNVISGYLDDCHPEMVCVSMDDL